MQRAMGVVLAVALAGCQPSLTDCLVLCAGERTGCPRDLVCGVDGYCYGDEAAAAALGCSAGMISTDGASGVDDPDGGGPDRPDGSTGKRPDAAVPTDAMPRPDAEPEPDAGDPGACATDPSEPNGTLGTARPTGIPPATRFHRTGLGLCPTGETDVFKLRAATARKLSATVTIEDNTTFAVQLTLLDATGLSLGTALVMVGSPGVVTKAVTTGDYYVEVKDVLSLAPSRYEIDITSSALLSPAR